MEDIIQIGNKKIGLGQQVKVNINVAKLPSNTIIDIPVFVFRGKEPGPKLLLLAGLHGDEVNGVEIIRQMIRDKTAYPDKGTVIAIPILNVYGFINYARDVADGKDVNRSFPGSPRGSLASRVAHFFMTEIFPNMDYGIDFHTGGKSRSNFPQIRCLTDLPEHMELAKVFNPPYILNSKLRDQSLRKNCTKAGKVMLVYEGGESLRLDNESIRIGIEGTKRVMQHLGMRNFKTDSQINSLYLPQSSWIRAKKSGLFQCVIKLGDQIKKNQLIGTITDPFGEWEIKIKSQKPGHVIGLNYNPVIRQGDAILHLGVL